MWFGTHGVPDGTPPKANIPTVEFPAADPLKDATVAAVAEELTSPENVYLLRVVDPQAAHELVPSANIAIVPGANPPEAKGHTPAFCQASIWSIVHMPGAVPHWNGPVGVAGLLVIMPP